MLSEPDLFIRQLKPEMPEEFRQLVQIYLEALPESERKPVSDIQMMLHRPEYELLIASVDNVVVAFSIVVDLSGADVCLLEYMAVFGNFRGMGIGRALFGKAVSTKRAASRYVLLEVDSDKGNYADRSDNKRRKDFYRRLGCKEVKDLDYKMPLATNRIPPPMDLLVYKKGIPAEIEKVRLRTWLQNVYGEVYRQSIDDVRINEMIAPLPDKVKLV